MRTFSKSHKLDNVCYDIRGPVMDEADRMIAAGEKILKLNMYMIQILVMLVDQDYMFMILLLT